MRHFGTVRSFDATTGRGSIQPGGAGEFIGFQKGAALWQRSLDPFSGQRLSYEVALTDSGARAVKLRNVYERDWSAWAGYRKRSKGTKMSASRDPEPSNADLERYGIERVPADTFLWQGYRYTQARDTLAAAKRAEKE